MLEQGALHLWIGVLVFRPHASGFWRKQGEHGLSGRAGARIQLVPHQRRGLKRDRLGLGSFLGRDPKPAAQAEAHGGGRGPHDHFPTIHGAVFSRVEEWRGGGFMSHPLLQSNAQGRGHKAEREGVFRRRHGHSQSATQNQQPVNGPR